MLAKAEGADASPAPEATTATKQPQALSRVLMAIMSFDLQAAAGAEPSCFVVGMSRFVFRHQCFCLGLSTALPVVHWPSRTVYKCIDSHSALFRASPELKPFSDYGVGSFR